MFDPPRDGAPPPEPRPASAPASEPTRAAPPDVEGDGGAAAKLRQARASLAFIFAVLGIFVLCARDAQWPMSLTAFRGWVPDAIALKYGAYTYPAVRDQGEWWRMFTTLFVARMGLDALFFGYIFWSYGPGLERLLGTARFIVLYLAAGAGGVAVGELFDPARTNAAGTGHTIGAVYACLGAVPGLVAGLTGSARAAVANPGARSAVTYIAFWTVFRYVILGYVELSVLGGAACGLLLGWGLALSTRDVARGVAATAGGLAVVAALVGAVAAGKRVEGGQLIDRGRPARPERLAGGGGPATESPEAPAPPALGTPDEASAAAREALAPVEPFLERFGPLPPSEGVTLREKEEALDHLARLEKVASGPNLVMGELDPALVRLHLLASNWHRAAELADQAVTLAPTPEARARAQALAGVAWLYKGNLDRAIDRLDAAVNSPGLVEALPEALFHCATAYAKRDGPVVAEAQLDRYLRLVGDGPHPAWRQRCVAAARQALGR